MSKASRRSTAPPAYGTTSASSQEQLQQMNVDEDFDVISQASCDSCGSNANITSIRSNCPSSEHSKLDWLKSSRRSELSSCSCSSCQSSFMDTISNKSFNDGSICHSERLPVKNRRKHADDHCHNNNQTVVEVDDMQQKIQIRMVCPTC